MNRSLSIHEWHQMAMEGNAPPVRIPLNGYSMFPLIRKGLDYVTIVPLDRDLIPGDIVLFAETDVERFVMHRVWEIRDGQILTWGDYCDKPDGWIQADKIWGRAVLIERGNRNIQPNPKKGMRWAKFWHKAKKTYEIYTNIRVGMNRIIKKLVG